MRDNPITVAIATLALVVGSCSAVGGVLVERSSHRTVCQAKNDNSVAVRGLLDDFLKANHATAAETTAADRLTAARFPIVSC